MRWAISFMLQPPQCLLEQIRTGDIPN